MNGRIERAFGETDLVATNEKSSPGDAISTYEKSADVELMGCLNSSRSKCHKNPEKLPRWAPKGQTDWIFLAHAGRNECIADVPRVEMICDGIWLMTYPLKVDISKMNKIVE